MITLVAAPGIVAYGYMSPVALSILLLLAIVVLSYVQVAKANPGGGGAYAVAKKILARCRRWWRQARHLPITCLPLQ